VCSPRISDPSGKKNKAADFAKEPGTIPVFPRKSAVPILAMQLPRIYPLTDVQLSGLSHAEQVHLLSLGGASLIQLREKRMPALEFYEQARAVKQYGVQLIINDRVDIALATGADGVHLGQDDLSPEVARKLLGPQAIIGYSTHNVDQAINATKLPIDYLAIGPIFSTITKSDTAPVLGLDGLRAVRNAVGGFPLVAIGGISLNNARDVIDAGADSVAVISALLTAPDITTATQTLRNRLG
jgi:thiamine-phosphate pyrophosphorylase